MTNFNSSETLNGSSSAIGWYENGPGADWNHNGTIWLQLLYLSTTVIGC